MYLKLFLILAFCVGFASGCILTRVVDRFDRWVPARVLHWSLCFRRFALGFASLYGGLWPLRLLNLLAWTPLPGFVPFVIARRLCGMLYIDRALAMVANPTLLAMLLASTLRRLH